MYKNSTTIFSFHSTTVDMPAGNVFTSGAKSTLDYGIDIIKKSSIPPLPTKYKLLVFVLIKLAQT